MRTWHSWAIAARPPWLRAHIGVCVVAAVVLPTVLGALPDATVPRAEMLTAGALIALSVINVEIGRLLDGGLRNSHRPHKALSAWALAAALLLPVWWVLPVVVTGYAHARWRGLRLQLWKWVGSGAYVVLAALAAHATAAALHGPGTGWVLGGPQALVVVSTACAVFLLVEVVLFHASAYLNDADDEVWLRRTLRSPRFYVTEASMLLVGGLSAAVWASNPWLLPLMLPAYGLAQQAALHDPLQQQARTDPKTGVFRYESWRSLALVERDRCTAKQQPWSVVFADLDRFKPYNDTFGHLAGDAALAAVAELLCAQLRSRDLVGRFGGEEFCLFLPDTAPDDAAEVAERLRTGVEQLSLPDTGASVTLSLGVASADPARGEPHLVQVIQAADEALYLAKARGRNAVHATTLETTEPGASADADGEHDQRVLPGHQVVALGVVMPLVAVVCGSRSDLTTLKGCFDVLDSYGISWEASVISAHRQADALHAYVAEAEASGVQLFIGAAGLAAHLPGVLASLTARPVIGIPLDGGALGGADALYSVVQMPPGVPVASVAIGSAGAKNAAHLAARILALADADVAERVEAFRADQAARAELRIDPRA